jgi:hypothetical protein
VSLTVDQVIAAHEAARWPSDQTTVVYNSACDSVIFFIPVAGIEEPKRIRRKIGRYIRRGRLPKGNYVMREIRRDR